MERRTPLPDNLDELLPRSASFQSASGSEDHASLMADLRVRFGALDPAYVDNVIVPHFLVRIYQGERIALPMIDGRLSKQNAMPGELWGLMSESWKPAPQDGVVLFLQGLDKRGPDNRRKRIYMSAVTPDLYRPMYGRKVMRFLERLLAPENAGKPLMQPYLEAYFDLYWDLHLGVSGDAIPAEARQFAHSLNIVLAYQDPTKTVVYENYMAVHANLSFMKQWIGARLADLVNGKTRHPEQTFAYYWLKNGQGDPNFQPKDIVAECVHDFFAFNQFGTTLYNVMLRLSANSGDSEIRAWFEKTMEGDCDVADGAFTPLERFVMELFRTIAPNAGSLSAIEPTGIRGPPAYVVIPHAATSCDPVHWRHPERFDPDRYKTVLTSDRVDEAKCEQIGFARCPFDRTAFEVKDGRNVALHNSGFGTVYATLNGRAAPVCDSAGFAPFGFGYRRCPGERFTIEVLEDFLRKVWRDQIQFGRLDIAHPVPIAAGPGAVVADDIGFRIGT
jgi:cytochrome P450